MRQHSRIGLALTFLLLAAYCKADIPLEIVQHAKLATALVEVEEHEDVGEGSAFCIDTNGLFVTNAHVVEDLRPGGKLMLVLHSGEPSQVKLAARVATVDTDNDLAILQTARPSKLTRLTLGSDEGLVETMPVAAFGYPFGSDLALKDGDFPNITVSTGHITSLRMVNGKLSVIQLDASLNPGNSGGPILNDKGEVIAIVMEGIPGSGINLAIPVRNLRALLARTTIAFVPPVVQVDHLRDPQEFRVQLLTPRPGGESVEVTITLNPGAKDERTFRATTTDGRNFTASAPLLPSEKRPSDIQITVDGGSYRVVAHTPDTKIRVGEVSVALSEINRIQGGPDPQVSLVDNRILRGAISGLPPVQIEIAGSRSTIKLSDFESIVINRPTVPDSVTYRIRGIQGGKEFANLGGSISLVGATPAISTAANSAVAAKPAPGSTPGSTPGYELIVSCLDSNDIRRFDAGTGEYLGDFAVGNGLSGPQDMQWGPDGNLYVCTAYTHSVRRFNGKTQQFIDAFVKDGSGGLNDAIGLTFGPDGNLYVSSHWTREVKRYNGKTGAFIDNFVKSGSGGLDRPVGVRFGPDGNLYVASFNSNLIKRYNGRTGAYMSDFAGGSGLQGPGAIEFGPNGDLYVCSGSNEVKHYDGKTGAFINNLVTAGSGGLSVPLGIMFAPDGLLYVGDKSCHIRRYNAKTGAFVDEFIGGNGMVYPGRMLYRGKPPIK